MGGHAYIKDGRRCKVCGRGPGDPVHLMVIPGFESVALVNERLQAEAEELAAKFKEPLKDISKAAGEMERKSPLFFGTGSNPGLF